MSRTYRRAMLNLNKNDKPFPPRKYSFYYSEGEYWEESPTDYYSKHNQKYDCKPLHKSGSSFKKTKKKIRKAKVRASMQKKDYDNVPKFKMENDWDWN